MTATTTGFRAGLVAITMVLSHAALADGGLAERTLTAADKQRLAQFETNMKDAVAEAKAGGSRADVETLDKVLAGPLQPILGVDIRGNYRCRTIKLGGLPPLTIYDWFACKIDEDGQGYRLVKTSGSQRLSGHFIDESQNRLLFYGASHMSDEKPKAYKADLDSDEVGYLVKTGPKHYRLDMPLPKLESKFDIIELIRK